MLAQEDLGKLLLRLLVGGLLLLHGIAKIRFGISGIEKAMLNQGLPAFLAWGVYIGEVLAPLLLLLGVHARLGALLISINMVVAITLMHSHQLSSFNASGIWTLELQAFFLFTALSSALLGPGRYSFGNPGRWN